MLTLWTMPNFKGTKKDAALVLFICLCIDCFVFMCCLSSCNGKGNADRHYESDISNIQTKAVQYIPARDYQIEIVEDSLLLFDGNRYVGSIPFGNTPVDSLIMADNE